MQNKIKIILRIFFGMIMLLLGIVIAVLSYNSPGSSGVLIQNIGLAFIVAGIVFIFQEAIIATLRIDEIQQNFLKLDSKIDNSLGEFPKLHAELKNSFKDFEENYGIKALGLHKKKDKRRGYEGYHKWVLSKTPQELFFAGNSVLHRVKADFKELDLPNVEDAFYQKLSLGFKIRILFLDPCWEFVKDIANSEGQSLASIQTDLATSLGICKLAWEKLANENLAGSLDIRLSQEYHQYAFHYAFNKELSEIEMLAGFYFAGRLGTESPLFTVENKDVQITFLQHFNTVFDRSNVLLEYAPPGIKKFNTDLYIMCKNEFSKNLDDSLISRLCP